MAVNEVDYTSVIVWTVGPERRCEVIGVGCVEVVLLRPHMDRCGRLAVKELCALVEAVWFLWDCL